MGALGMFATFQVYGHSLDAVLLLFSASHHRFFAEHHVLNAFFVIANSFEAIEPFHLSELLIVGILVEEPD